MKPHDIQRRQAGIQPHEQGGDNGEIFCHIVGNRESGEAAARHQKLFANADDINQLRRGGIEIHHIAGLLSCLRAAVHRHCNVCLRKGRRVVGAVAGHCHKVALALEVTDHLQLTLRGSLCKKVIYAGFGSDGRCGQGVIARNHDRLYTHLAQIGEFFLYASFDNIFEVNYAEDFMVFCYD